MEIKKTVIEKLHDNIKRDTEEFIKEYVHLDKYKEDEDNQLVEDIWFGLFNDAVSEVVMKALDNYYN